MILLTVQLASLAAVVVYLGRSRLSIGRRNRQTWESIIARLRPSSGLRELSNQFLWKEGLNATPEETWDRIKGTKGLWAMYQNAKVMLEMVDYATRNCPGIDLELVQNLRNDAVQIRMCILGVLAQNVMSQAKETVSLNAFRAASMYSGMAARMTSLLQEHASMALPDFVAAM